ncbi:Pycsar system effector family protein [Streptococcus suis]|uniref:Pycsar system effector family protein n=1 Tax=Streptococcus suis TaxID=1307 RepID=UPI000CF3C134|nr:Pycsar system effector family protein [Streptococcus suis]
MENLKNIYDDTTGWLKFIEAKLTAFLTFETGLFYFIAKLKTDFSLSFCLVISLVGVGISILTLLYALLPTISKTINPFYFLTWSDDEFHFTSEVNFEELYEEQIRQLSKVAKKKMSLLRFSVIVYTLSVFIFLILL